MKYRENKYGIYKYITSDYVFLFYSMVQLPWNTQRQLKNGYISYIFPKTSE